MLDLVPNAPENPGPPGLEELLKDFLQTAATGLVVQGGDGRVIDCNPAAEYLMGLTREQLLTLRPGPGWQAIHRDGSPARLHDLPGMRSLRTGEAVKDAVMGVSSPDAPRRWLNCNAVPFNWPADPQAPSVITSMTDITATVEAQILMAQSESRFRSMFTEHHSVMLLIEPESGAIVDANDSACAFYGYDREHLTRLNISDVNTLSPEEIRQRHAAAFAGQQQSFVFPHRLADGSIRTVEVHSSPIHHENLLFSIIHDITEAEAARKALTASEEHYRLLAEQISDVVVRSDLSGVMRWVSPSVNAATGWLSPELEGQPFLALVHPEDLIGLDGTFTTEEGTRVQARLHMRDGAFRWFDIHVDPLHDADGEITGWVSRWRDIDDERRAEVALTHVRDRLALVMESSQLGMWDWNMLTGELVLNQRWAQIVGHTLDDLAPVSIQTWADLAHPEDLIVSNALVDTHARGFSEFYEFECRMRHRDGRWIWVLDRGRIVEWDAHGNPVRMTGTHQDITDRKEAEERLAASEARYRSLVERMTDVVVALDTAGVITFASPSFADLLGWPPEEWIGVSAMDLVFDDADHDDAVKAFEQMLRTESTTARMRLRCQDGGYRWIEAATQGGGLTSGVIAVWRDVTDAVEREAAQRQQTSLLSAITSHVGDVVIHLEDGVIAWVSPSISTEFGGVPQDWVGVELAQHVHPEDKGLLTAARRRLDAGLRDRTRLRLRDLSDAYHWVDVIGTAAGEDSPGGVVLSVRVIDEDIAREGSLRRLAGSDSLTGLANRRELMNRLAVLLSGANPGCAVIFCDVDNLKHLNDNYGHSVGDTVLIATATRIQATVRPDDLCARFGGDEFVVLLKGVTNSQGALSAAQRIREATEQAITVVGGQVHTTLSMGVAVSHRGETPGPLLNRADEAMYQAKREGRNRTILAE